MGYAGTQNNGMIYAKSVQGNVLCVILFTSYSL